VRADIQKTKDDEKYDGEWVVGTDDDTFSLEDAACGYKSLMVIDGSLLFIKLTRQQSFLIRKLVCG
jgi:hypothetical protein